MRRLFHRPTTDAARAYARTTMPDRQTPWRDGRYIIVDLETTGLTPGRDEIISFGAVPIEHGRILASEAVYALARPRQSLPPESVRIHGILPSDLEDAPPLGDVIGRLLDVMGGRVLVAHVAWVERRFLERAFRPLGVRLRRPLLDTSAIGRLWLFERDGHLPNAIALSTLARALRVPTEREHHALGDALTAAQVFLAAATHLDQRRRETIGTLADAERRTRVIRRVFPPTTPPAGVAERPQPGAASAR
jgi:DNA polymerase III subunit epsilon